MPGQLLPLRLLRCSSGLLYPASGTPMLRRAFPFKLKYSCLPSKHPRPFSYHHVGGYGVRAFSARSGGGRGGFRTGGVGREARSLIDDEAELSDWVSDLKTDNFRAGLGITSDEEEDSRAGPRGRDMGGRVGVREVRGRGRISLPSARGSRASDEEEDSRAGPRGRDMGGRVGVREGRGRGRISLPSARGSRASDEEEDSRAGPRGRDMGGRVGVREGRGGGRTSLPLARGSRVSSKRQRGNESEDDFASFADRRQSRSSARPFQSSRGRGSKMLLDSDLDEDEEDDDNDNDEYFSAKRRGERETRDRSSPSLVRRGRKDSDLGVGPERGRPSRNGFSSPPVKRGERDPVASRGGELDRGKPAFELSEEEEEEDDDVGSFEDESGLDDESPSEEEDANEVKGKDPFGILSSSVKPAEGDGAPPSPKRCEGNSESYLSETRFDQCSLSPLSLKGIREAGYERMTVVQEATLSIILKGKDVLAKAKTGTGKTVAFLLPSIEIIVKQPPADRDQRRPPIHVLVICPTRELANQAATEADTLLKFHPSVGVQFVTGGTRLALEQKRMQANPCQILVATPGRLRDHIENTPGFATRLMSVKVLVLDEADRLLDMGFRKDIEKIIAAVPKQRQTLLFSATVAEEVRQICHIALKRDHEFVNTVEEGSEETHSQVSQTLLVAPLDKHFSLLYHILSEHISDDVDYKVLVFCTTAMVTRLVAEVLSELKLNVREIHSRKPQSYRTRVSDEFRKSKGLILVTSDVSARGVDYPDVTLVIQVGVPSDRAQYIHRLGRTGRKGKEGKGILMLAPWEEYFVSTIKDLPISKSTLPSMDPDTRKKVERALAHAEMKNKESAYQAWLGYYNSNKNVGRDKCKLVELANEFSRSMGLDNPPAIPKLVLGKMGLRNVPGLRAK